MTGHSSIAGVGKLLGARSYFQIGCIIRSYPQGCPTGNVSSRPSEYTAVVILSFFYRRHPRDDLRSALNDGEFDDLSVRTLTHRKQFGFRLQRFIDGVYLDTREVSYAAGILGTRLKII